MSLRGRASEARRESYTAERARPAAADIVMSKTPLTYLVLLLVFGGGTFVTLKAGTFFYSGRAAASQPATPTPAGGQAPREERAETSAPAPEAKAVEKDARDPLSVLLLQVIVILVAAKLLGWLVGMVKQPAVVGEMIAGILLGSSLLGVVSPSLMTFLFPVQSMDTLKLLSQIGVIIFMFIVGMELDLQHLRRKANDAVLISHASIVIPLLLGTILALVIYDSAAPSGVPFNAFALFMGIAMSITAFPVLARILKERGLTQTRLGTTAIACAAVDDATAWCLLAVVVSIAKADGLGNAGLTVAAALLFSGLMLFLLRPYAERLGDAAGSETQREKFLWAALTLVFVSSLITEHIGIHALFGAFLAGVVMPSRPALRSFLTERLGSFTSVLLPLFFAFTGLRTQINLLEGWSDWVMCAGVVAVAVAGKLGGGMLAARWTGMGWLDSTSIGVLMNTRGLMELVVLNIGYDLGILTPRIFSMMVVMALVTTFMTGPMLSLIDRLRKPEFVGGEVLAEAPPLQS